MIRNMSVWQIWGLALSLIVLDVALVSLYFSQPVASLSNSTSAWDFRISELRQYETRPHSAVAGVNISRDSLSPQPSITPTPASILLKKMITSPVSPVAKPWHMPFGSLFGTNGTTAADSQSGPARRRQ